jgi:hypothetical protein
MKKQTSRVSDWTVLKNHLKTYLEEPSQSPITSALVHKWKWACLSRRRVLGTMFAKWIYHKPGGERVSECKVEMALLIFYLNFLDVGSLAFDSYSYILTMTFWYHTNKRNQSREWGQRLTMLLPPAHEPFPMPRVRQERSSAVSYPKREVWARNGI